MKKNILFLVILIAVVIAALVFGVRIQSVQDYYLEHLEDVQPDSRTVTMSIRCDTALENREKLDPALQTEKFLPKDGIVLKTTEYVLREGDSVFSLLERAAKHEKIQFEFKGTGKNGGTAYVEGISYLYEFSCGPLSGWMYRVNGKFPGVGCSEYFPEDGDVIEWVYSCDLGHDVGDDWQGE